MRRPTSIKPHLRVRLRLIGGVLLAALAWYGAARLDAKIQPALQEMAEYESRAVTVEAMNAAIAQEMEAYPQRYKGLYVIRYAQDGSIAAVESDSVALNQARMYLVKAVTQALRELPETELQIPWGSLLDSAFLNDRGPSWSLCIQPRGYVEGNIQEGVREIEINKAEYCIDLELSTSINMILDGENHLLDVKNTVPIAHILMDGTTPSYYSQGDA